VIVLHLGQQVAVGKLEAAILWILTVALIWLHLTLLRLFRSRPSHRRRIEGVSDVRPTGDREDRGGS
jgi:hypothetical protein